MNAEQDAAIETAEAEDAASPIPPPPERIVLGKGVSLQAELGPAPRRIRFSRGEQRLEMSMHPRHVQALLAATAAAPDGTVEQCTAACLDRLEQTLLCYILGQLGILHNE